MNVPNYSSMCRTCLSQSVSIKPVFNDELIMDQEVVLCDMIMACASVTIIKDDGLPPNICFNCIEDLRKAFTFKKICEESDNILRSCVETEVEFKIEIEDHKPNVNVIEEGCAVLGNHITTLDENLSLNEQCDSGANYEENLKESLVKSDTNTKEKDRNKKLYKCDEHKEESLELAAYEKHMANVHGKKFKCGSCEKEFKAQHLLKQHETVHHREDESQTKRKSNKTGITKKRKLSRICEICNKAFRTNKILNQHKMTHTEEKLYLCNVCGKRFRQMSYLKDHSYIHTGEKPYKCEICDKSFADRGTRMTHVRIHTGEKPYVCKICGKSFRISSCLSAHIRTHTGERPVECKVCNRRFKESGKLVTHMRTHSGEKPYSCKECGRSFALNATLKKHIRTHTGERPYVCSVCGQAFAQSGTLASHKKVHRPKQ